MCTELTITQVEEGLYSGGSYGISSRYRRPFDLGRINFFVRSIYLSNQPRSEYDTWVLLYASE